MENKFTRHFQECISQWLEKLQRDGWQFGWVNSPYFTLWKTERIEMDEK